MVEVGVEGGVVVLWEGLLVMVEVVWRSGGDGGGGGWIRSDGVEGGVVVEEEEGGLEEEWWSCWEGVVGDGGGCLEKGWW